MYLTKLMGNKPGKLQKDNKPNKIHKNNKPKTTSFKSQMDVFNIKPKTGSEFYPKTHKHLIVDDAIYNRLILSKYLEKVNVTVDEASNGSEVVDSYPDLEKYDIIWMDLRMPILDGFECTIHIRSKGYKGIIIGVTGDVSPDNMKRCYEVGMDQVILKPIIYKEFINSQYIQPYAIKQN